MRTEMAARACLRQATRAHQEQLQALPFFRSLAAATMDAASYLDFLKVMVIVHEAMDEAARRLLGRFASELWDERCSRRAAFAADIASLEESGTRQRAVNAQVHALALGEELMALAEADDTMALLGALYVLRGLALGAPVLRAQLERSCQNGLDLPTSALAKNASEAHTEWERFGDALDAAVCRPADIDRAVQGAQIISEKLQRALAALSPAPNPPRVTAAALNPEAGNHSIGRDPMELKAALKAGRISWQRFPYYKWRFGARGRRFTRSDSAWLVTLVQCDSASMKQQIDWLGMLLSSRGMPQWLLEQHLETLVAELLRAFPDRLGHYDGLRGAAQHLRAGRCSQISEVRFTQLWSAFDATVDEVWRSRLPEAGALLIAAVADRKAGIRQAVSSLESWMTDPARFPRSWIEAARATLRDATADPSPPAPSA